MQAQTVQINAIPLQKQENNFIHPIKAWVKGTKGFVLATLYIIPVTLIEVASLASSIFGSYTKSLTCRLNSLYDKAFATLIFHNINEANAIFQKNILSSAKNICRKEVIWKEEDIKWSNEFIRQIQDKQFFKSKGIKPLTDEELAKIANYPIKGAISDGICLGASLCAIKNLIEAKITKEKELIESLKPFENGFGPFAAALQNLQAPLRNLYNLNDDDYEIVKEELNQEKEEKAQKKNIQQKEQRLKNQLYIFKNRMIRLSRIAALIDLKLKCTIKDYNKTHFSGIEKDSKVQRKFNKIENGYYQMYLKTGKNSLHSIVYIKKNFGSYVFDPNFGLIKCTSDNHGEEVAKFLNNYPTETTDKKIKGHSLQIFQYALY